MDEKNLKRYTAFESKRCLASGDLAQVVMKVKEAIDRGEGESVLIFDDFTSETFEMDFRGTMKDVLRRLQKQIEWGESVAAPVNTDQNVVRGPGRPKLGVVSREVTLLPRHWDWLNSQPGGASVALRKLVEEARRVNSGKDKVRHSQEAAYRFMSAMAGNLPGFEEATRALFRADREHFDSLVASWPADIREYARKLSYVALQSRASGSAG
ncbi:MAG: DUF2239 family protein [Deltaproteobacteria bacterium]|nr:DUF2239 family protein [Deltaproteobacteria bacterium]